MFCIVEVTSALPSLNFQSNMHSGMAHEGSLMEKTSLQPPALVAARILA